MASTATARWDGTLADGSGTMTTGTGLTAPYTRASRFADGDGSNPEELIGAAHAGCFSMFLAGLLGKNGTPPTSVETTARVSLDMSGPAPRIGRIDLTSRAVVPDIDEDTFQELAAAAKEDCPISAALASVPDVRLTATLES